MYLVQILKEMRSVFVSIRLKLNYFRQSYIPNADGYVSLINCQRQLKTIIYAKKKNSILCFAFYVCIQFYGHVVVLELINFDY